MFKLVVVLSVVIEIQVAVIRVLTVVTCTANAHLHRV